MWGWGFEGSTTGSNDWNNAGIDLSVLRGEAVAMTILRKMHFGIPPTDIE